jgi:hypothetical protein
MREELSYPLTPLTIVFRPKDCFHYNTGIVLGVGIVRTSTSKFMSAEIASNDSDILRYPEPTYNCPKTTDTVATPQNQ